ncbi:MAG: hypothetical protein Q4G70_00415 [Pseudomonadota bacterium]|nr:hypothetical protein [Pseudomonadota bacterium]
MKKHGPAPWEMNSVGCLAAVGYVVFKLMMGKFALTACSRKPGIFTMAFKNLEPENPSSKSLRHAHLLRVS